MERTDRRNKTIKWSAGAFSTGNRNVSTCKKLHQYAQIFGTSIPCVAIAVHSELAVVLQPNRMSPCRPPVCWKN